MEYGFSEEERTNIRESETLKGFIEKYNRVIYDEVEAESNLIGKKIQLKKGKVNGHVICLWLPKDDNAYRKKHQWYVRWETGKYGVVEKDDITKCISKYVTFGYVGHWCATCEHVKQCDNIKGEDWV